MDGLNPTKLRAGQIKTFAIFGWLLSLSREVNVKIMICADPDESGCFQFNHIDSFCFGQMLPL